MAIVTNGHTHLELGWMSGHCPAVTGQSFVSWANRLVSRRFDADDSREQVTDAAIEDGILELMAAGMTHVGDVSATGRSIGPLLASGLKGIVYVEVLGLDAVTAQTRFDRARAIIDQWRPQARDDFQIGLSIHAPYSVIPGLWEMALNYARREALPLCIHVAESAAEFDFWTRDTGPLVDEYYLALDLLPPKAPLITPVQYLEDIGALDLKPLLVHGIHVTAADIMRIAEHECAVVHCPRSNLRLQCGRMPLEAYLTAGVPVYLGTDSRASSPSLDVHDDLEVAMGLHYGRVAPEAIAALLHQPLPLAHNDVEADSV